MNDELIAEDFLRHVEFTNTCWNWRDDKNASGYGIYYPSSKLNEAKRRYLAHRYSFGLFIDDLLPGLVIDHLCRNICCVNPNHLEQVSHSLNSIRAVPFRKNRVKREDRNTCRQGHDTTPENTIYIFSVPTCKVCYIIN